MRRSEVGIRERFYRLHLALIFVSHVVVDGLLLAAKIWKAAEEEPDSLKGYMHIESMGETSCVVFEVRFQCPVGSSCDSIGNEERV